MTIEEIELRKLLTQMLADNGINRETITDFVKDAISDKIDKAIKNVIHTTNLDNTISHYIKQEISKDIASAVRFKVNNAFSNIHVTVDCGYDKDKVIANE